MDSFTAISEPTRRAILDELAADERTVGALVERTGMSQPAVSKHLKVLRETDLVTVRVDGPQRWYAIEPRGIAEIDRWIDRFRTMWADKLDGLETFLDEQE